MIDPDVFRSSILLATALHPAGVDALHMGGSSKFFKLFCCQKVLVNDRDLFLASQRLIADLQKMKGTAVDCYMLIVLNRNIRKIAREPELCDGKPGVFHRGLQVIDTHENIWFENNIEGRVLNIGLHRLYEWQLFQRVVYSFGTHCAGKSAGL
jgi:hypothetical protein